jgi:hypothetical protein
VEEFGCLWVSKSRRASVMEETKDITVKIILLDAPGEVNAYRLNKINSAKKIKVGLEQIVGSVDEFVKIAVILLLL